MLSALRSYYLSGLPDMHIEGGEGLSQQARDWDSLLCVILHILNKRRPPRQLYWQENKVI